MMQVAIPHTCARAHTHTTNLVDVAGGVALDELPVLLRHEAEALRREYLQAAALDRLLHSHLGKQRLLQHLTLMLAVLELLLVPALPRLQIF
jgi:hypothetical protein